MGTKSIERSGLDMSKKDNKENKTKEIFNKIVEGVQNIVNSGEYAKFLKFSKNFHNYSFNNVLLIFSQMEEATRVAGFAKWKSMGRNLKKGAKGIQIIYPIKRSYTKKKLEGQDSLLDDNNKEQEVEYMTYRYTYVYDISQTVGKPLPLENNALNSDNKKEFYKFLKTFSPYKIEEEDIFGTAKGYWIEKEQKIIIKKSLSIDDKVSVLLHELTHAFYDDFDYKEDRNLSETFVESVAFIVADYFDLDTSLCSFEYIASWVGEDTKIILELGNKIQKCANSFIKKLEEFYNNGNLQIAI